MTKKAAFYVTHCVYIYEVHISVKHDLVGQS